MAVIQGEQTRVLEQEKFYSDRSFKIVLLMFLIAFLGFALFGLNFLFLKTTSPAPTYFEASPQGSIFVEIPLDQSNMESNVLLNWVTEAMLLSSTFNFVNYPSTLAQASIYFTKDGFESYRRALDNLKLIDKVIQRKLVLRGTPSDAPQILLEKAFAGRYMWKIRIPMKFDYRSVTMVATEEVIVTLVVMRVPITQSPNGVSILKYSIEKAQ